MNMTFENGQNWIIMIDSRKILNKVYSLDAFPMPCNNITNNVKIDSYFDNNAPLIESLIKGYMQMGDLNLKIVNEFKPCERDNEIRISEIHNKKN